MRVASSLFVPVTVFAMRLGKSLAQTVTTVDDDDTIKTEVGGAIQILAPATMACQRPEDGFSSPTCCKSDNGALTDFNGLSTYQFFSAGGDVTYCSHTCTQEKHQVVDGPADVECPAESWGCLQAGDNVNGVWSVEAHMTEAKCSEKCTVTSKADNFTGPTLITCLFVSTCFDGDGAFLNYTSSNETTGELFWNITEFDKSVKCRMGDCTENKVYTRKVVGPARIECPAGSALCIDESFANISPPGGNDLGNALVDVNEGTEYYCAVDCTVLEEAVISVQGPAVVVCPTASVQCTGGPHSGGSSGDGTTSRIEIQVAEMVQCSNQCQVEEQSVAIRGPAQATCPSDSVGCFGLSGEDTLTTTEQGTVFYCSQRCQIDSSIEVHGPASIVCGLNTVGCTMQGSGANDASGSQYQLACGESGFCSQACTVDGDSLGSGASRFFGIAPFVFGVLFVLAPL